MPPVLILNATAKISSHTFTKRISTPKVTTDISCRTVVKVVSIRTSAITRTILLISLPVVILIIAITLCTLTVTLSSLTVALRTLIITVVACLTISHIHYLTVCFLNLFKFFLRQGLTVDFRHLHQDGICG